MPLQKVALQPDSFRGVAFPFEITHSLNLSVFRHAKASANRTAADFRKWRFTNLVVAGIGFHNPVIPRDADVENSILNVSSLLQNSNQEALDLIVVSARKAIQLDPMSAPARREVAAVDSCSLPVATNGFVTRLGMLCSSMERPI